MLVNRDELFDLGASGPLAGLVVAALVSAIGLRLSAITSITSQDLSIIQTPLFFELIGSLVSPNVPNGYVLVLSPVAYAGWAGFLLTYLQLLPVWQLDGAHVSYAVFGRKVYRFLWILGLGLMVLSGFFMMAMLVIMFMTLQRDAHPALLDEVSPLSRSRKALYLIVLLATIGCMTISAI
jgi:membrane-associated protease RseP (regulator of RpoE activity)